MDEKEARKLVERIEKGELKSRNVSPKKLMELVLWLDNRLLKAGSEAAGVRASLRNEIETRQKETTRALEAEKKMEIKDGLLNGTLARAELAEKELKWFNESMPCGHVLALKILGSSLDPEKNECLWCGFHKVEEERDRLAKELGEWKQRFFNLEKQFQEEAGHHVVTAQQRDEWLKQGSEAQSRLLRERDQARAEVERLNEAIRCETGRFPPETVAMEGIAGVEWLGAMAHKNLTDLNARADRARAAEKDAEKWRAECKRLSMLAGSHLAKLEDAAVELAEAKRSGAELREEVLIPTRRERDTFQEMFNEEKRRADRLKEQVEDLVKQLRLPARAEAHVSDGSPCKACGDSFVPEYGSPPEKCEKCGFVCPAVASHAWDEEQDAHYHHQPNCPNNPISRLFEMTHRIVKDGKVFFRDPVPPNEGCADTVHEEGGPEATDACWRIHLRLVRNRLASAERNERHLYNLVTHREKELAEAKKGMWISDKVRIDLSDDSPPGPSCQVCGKTVHSGDAVHRDCAGVNIGGDKLRMVNEKYLNKCWVCGGTADACSGCLSRVRYKDEVALKMAKVALEEGGHQNTLAMACVREALEQRGARKA